MLISLYVENIALIKKLSVEFKEGFCVFTGETGAGKSILIDAINLLCGARSDKELIRTGEEFAFSEGAFYIGNFPETAANLKSIEIEADEEGMIYLSRKISSDGRSISKINGVTVPLAKLREAASFLITIYGQQAAFSLMKPENYVLILDSYAGNSEILKAYQKKYFEYIGIKKQLKALLLDENEKNSRIEFLKYRLNEINSAKLKQGEEEKLQQLKIKLLGAEKLKLSCGDALNMLTGTENPKNAFESVDFAVRQLNGALALMPELNELSSRLEAVKYEIEDIGEQLSKQLFSIPSDENGILDKAEERLLTIAELKRKYGGSVEAALDNAAEMQRELDGIENSEEQRKKLEAELKTTRGEVLQAAAVLTESRSSAALTLSAAVKEELKQLDMGGALFEAAVAHKTPGENGAEEISFLISANLGEPPKPIDKIASGGELSRIMLALTSVLAEKNPVGTLIFDEIDTGISGKTNRKIGLTLKKLASRVAQTLCVTHSAQIAALADSHYKIEKFSDDGRSFTSLEKLSRDGRIKEIARIMGGINVTENIYAAAEDLLEETE